MVKRSVLVLSVAMMLFFSSLALADCVSLASFTDWVAQDTHKVVFYRGTRPLGTLDIPNCFVTPSSAVIIIKSYVCDSDKIIIDGEECTIMAVKSAAF